MQVQGEVRLGEGQTGDEGAGRSGMPADMGGQEAGHAVLLPQSPCVDEHTAFLPPTVSAAAEGGSGSSGALNSRGVQQSGGSADSTAAAAAAVLREGEQWAVGAAAGPPGRSVLPLSTAKEVFDDLIASGVGVSRHSISVRGWL